MDSNTVLVAQVKKSVTLFTLLRSSIALITLVVGGMGINNMMLVSLTERFKEIGLCKALGATDKSLRAQFLLEATLLAVLAGIVGLIFGFAAYESILYFASKAVSENDLRVDCGILRRLFFPLFPSSRSVWEAGWCQPSKPNAFRSLKRCVANENHYVFCLHIC